MRTILILASAALISAATFTGPAAAEDRLNLTPPLYRDQALATQQARRLDLLTTTPQPVATGVNTVRSASAARRPIIQASAAALR